MNFLEPKRKHPRHWKSDENIVLTFLTHESFCAEMIYKLVDKESIIEFCTSLMIRDHECVGLWYTLDNNNCVVRIGTSTNLLHKMTTFDQRVNEYKIYIGIADQYAKDYMNQIKQNYKRICMHNYLHGKGYKILDENEY